MTQGRTNGECADVVQSMLCEAESAVSTEWWPRVRDWIESLNSHLRNPSIMHTRQSGRLVEGFREQLVYDRLAYPKDGELSAVLGLMTSDKKGELHSTTFHSGLSDGEALIAGARAVIYLCRAVGAQKYSEAADMVSWFDSLREAAEEARVVGSGRDAVTMDQICRGSGEVIGCCNPHDYSRAIESAYGKCADVYDSRPFDFDIHTSEVLISLSDTLGASIHARFPSGALYPNIIASHITVIYDWVDISGKDHSMADVSGCLRDGHIPKCLSSASMKLAWDAIKFSYGESMS